MTREERHRRRALIVRRWVAHRVNCEKREIWQRRRAPEADDLDEGAPVDDLLADLPDGLVD